jgi:predicted type IV restriction endonuclease
LRKGEVEDLEVFDPLRKKWFVLTPEEWVRQHFVHYLLSEYGYSAHRMANEVGLRLNNTLRRCDTVVYDDYMQPLMIVEYKASHIQITQRVFDQIARYNMVLGAKYLIVSNGLNHYCCSIADGNVTFMRNIPRYEDIK